MQYLIADGAKILYEVVSEDPTDYVESRPLESAKIVTNYLPIDVDTMIAHLTNPLASDAPRNTSLFGPYGPGSPLPAMSQSSVGKFGKAWPMGRLPGEMFEQIMDYLCREDIASMRLVCKEFDCKTSRAFFETIVVPFNTGVFGTLKPLSAAGSDGSPSERDRIDSDGAYSQSHAEISWTKSEGTTSLEGQGLSIFKEFGHRFRRFGMSFEVDEGKCPD